MPKQIYNEGRVVGLSAYEIYVKQHMYEDPDVPPATEREWLASSIAMGSSMLMRLNSAHNTPRLNSVNSTDDYKVIEIPLPSTSIIAAANTVIASFFDGEGEYPDGSNWATKIVDYGPLIPNTLELHPGSSESSPVSIDTAEDIGNKIPKMNFSSSEYNQYLESKSEEFKDYEKIVDGVIIQPGIWTNTESGEPYRGFAPAFSDRPVVRILVKGDINSNLQILLTGFTIRTVLQGIAGEGSEDSQAPQNGDFIGPGLFPWASKIIFSMPTSSKLYGTHTEYYRYLGAHADGPGSGGVGDINFITVADSSMIDIQSMPMYDYQDHRVMRETSYDPESQSLPSTVPADASYYAKARDTDQYLFKKAPSQTASYLDLKKGSRVPSNVFSYQTTNPKSDLATLVVYQKDRNYPPALYSALVGRTGEQYIHPVDSVAPGSVKVFTNAGADVLKDYESKFPGTVGMSRDSHGNLSTIDIDGRSVRISSKFRDYKLGQIAVDNVSKQGGHDVHTHEMLQLQLEVDPEVANITKNVFEIPNYLISNVEPPTPQQPTSTVVPYGSKISSYDIVESIYHNRYLDILESRLISAKSSLIRSTPYLEFGPENNKKRLYISLTEPTDTDIPEGSIGIGWGFTADSDTK